MKVKEPCCYVPSVVPKDVHELLNSGECEDHECDFCCEFECDSDFVFVSSEGDSAVPMTAHLEEHNDTRYQAKLIRSSVNNRSLKPHLQKGMANQDTQHARRSQSLLNLGLSWSLGAAVVLVLVFYVSVLGSKKEAELLKQMNEKLTQIDYKLKRVDQATALMVQQAKSKHLMKSTVEKEPKVSFLYIILSVKLSDIHSE